MVLYWKDTANVIVEESRKYFIDAIFNKSLEMEWRFTRFYGELETYRRIEAWNKLKGLNSRPNIP